MQFPDGRIMVFCKAPQPGKVKTRLAKAIGETAAVRIHEYLALHCLRNAVDACIAPVELWCAPDVDHSFFQRAEERFGVALKKQKGQNLGQRMEYAFSHSLSDCLYSVVVGTDCPAINVDYLVSAFFNLADDKSVIGPAEDGGYVLLGLHKPQPKVFSNMPWGTPGVFEETMSRFNDGAKVEELSVLWDIDHVEDLIRLHSEPDALNLEDDFLEYLNALEREKRI